MNPIDQILDEATRLPEDQKLTLVNKLLRIGEPETSDAVQNAWDNTIRERIARYDRGEICSRSANDVFADLDKRLKR
jgi:hypothetical protein